MKRHVNVGADILSLVDFPYPVVPIVRRTMKTGTAPDIRDGMSRHRHSDRRANSVRGRLLRRADVGSAVPPAHDRQRRSRSFVERSGAMYDPHVVDTFVRVYRDIPMSHIETPAQREVLQQISQSRHEVERPQELAPDLRRRRRAVCSPSSAYPASWTVPGPSPTCSALSSKLLADVMPGSSGAWYMPEGTSDRLTVADAFGPAAPVLRGMSIDVGDRLTGWVAASRQPIVNSDAALDLGSRMHAISPLRSCMSVPIAIGPSLVAVLTLYAEPADAFSADQSRLIQMVAPHLASAIHAASGRADATRPPVAQERAAGGRDLRLVAAR